MFIFNDKQFYTPQSTKQKFDNICSTEFLDSNETINSNELK